MVGMNNTVSVSMKALLTGIAVFCGALWAVLTFTLGGLKDEAAALRLSLDRTTEAVRTIDRDSIQRTSELNGKLSERIQSVGLDLAKLESTVGRLDSNVTRLEGAINKFDGTFGQVSGRLDQFGKAIDNLSGKMDFLSVRMDKLQATMTPSPETDARRASQLAEYLKRSGLDKDRIIIVPAGVFPN